MVKKYCKGFSLYLAAVAAALFVHAIALHWDDEANQQVESVRSAVRA